MFRTTALAISQWSTYQTLIRGAGGGGGGGGGRNGDGGGGGGCGGGARAVAGADAGPVVLVFFLYIFVRLRLMLHRACHAGPGCSEAYQISARGFKYIPITWGLLFEKLPIRLALLELKKIPTPQPPNLSKPQCGGCYRQAQ